MFFGRFLITLNCGLYAGLAFWVRGDVVPLSLEVVFATV